MSHRLLILCYHNVTATSFFPSPDGEANLARQLRLLRRTARVVPLGDAVEALGAGERLPARAVSITFDDGYRDNLDVAVPVLERLHLPATFFLAPDILERRVKAWWERLAWSLLHATAPTVRWGDAVVDPARLRPADIPAFVTRVAPSLRPLAVAEREAAVAELVAACAPEGQPPEEFLDWAGARALSARGFEVGSHSQSHLIVSGASPAVQAADLAGSRRELEAGLGMAVRLLAYPSGAAADFNDDTVAAAQAAGYTHAFTTLFGWNNPTTPRFALRRVVVEPRDKTRGLLEPLWWERRTIVREFARRVPTVTARLGPTRPAR